MNGLARRLRDYPVFVEVVPPKLGASPAAVEQALAAAGDVLDQARVDAVNVPEIIGSGFQGMDPFDFGLLLHERYQVDVVINKVVAHHSRETFPEWVDRILASEIASVVLVGGEHGGIYYPGPTVLEGNRIVRERAEHAGRRDLPIGNVTIATRTREAVRMLEKIRAGCDYFTSQIVYESAAINAHVQAYEDVCTLASLAPVPVLYAFSPAETPQDVVFLRYLGVNLPPQVERALLTGDRGHPHPSVPLIHQVWSDFLQQVKERAVTVPLGVIVETVSRRNVAATVELLRGFQSQKPTAASPLTGRPQV